MSIGNSQTMLDAVLTRIEVTAKKKICRCSM